MAEHHNATPDVITAAQFIFGDTAGDLLILSGPAGAGKSSLCTQLADSARAAGLVTGGLIATAVFADGRKIGIDLVDQLSGERRRLAGRRAAGDRGLVTKQWAFDTAVLAWGNQRLLDLPPCDLIFIDELGPLELQRDEGLLAGPELIDRRGAARLVAVIRPSLLAQARARWPWGRVLDLGAASGAGDD